MTKQRVEALGEVGDTNEVRLIGRISSAPERRVLPSGDEVLLFRIVVQRPDGGVDAVPVQVGPAPPAGGRLAPGLTGRRVLAAVERFDVDDRVEVSGGLRRRWWEAGGARRSVLEVRATTVVPAPPD
jgi:single-strand DNA-binding protein